MAATVNKLHIKSKFLKNAHGYICIHAWTFLQTLEKLYQLDLKSSHTKLQLTSDQSVLTIILER